MVILYIKKNGNVVPFREFEGAGRCALLLWYHVGEKYLGRIPKSDEIGAVWKLSGDKSIPEHVRVVLFHTFDVAIVRFEEIGRLIDAFEKYISEDPDPGHLPEEVATLREIQAMKGISGACWNVNHPRRNAGAFPVWSRESPGFTRPS